MSYIILGYDIINGSRQFHKSKYKRVETIAEIDLFEKQVKEGYKRIGQKVQVYAVYKYKPVGNTNHASK